MNMSNFIVQDISAITLTEVDQIVPPFTYVSFVCGLVLPNEYNKQYDQYFLLYKC